MRYKWLNKKDNKNCIIFFNGWGMDENIIKHLTFEQYDVLMFYDYNTLQTDFNFDDLSNYSKKYLIAWSMGVMTATLINLDYTKKVAINGTLKPIDNLYGIPEKIYNLTLKGFSHNSAEKFIQNMFDKNILEKIDTKKISDRNFDNQKEELEALTHYSSNLEFKYDKIIISDNDKIIPTKNQTRFWNQEPNIKSGHAPFYIYKSWGELLV